MGLEVGSLKNMLHTKQQANISKHWKACHHLTEVQDLTEAITSTGYVLPFKDLVYQSYLPKKLTTPLFCLPLEAVKPGLSRAVTEGVHMNSLKSLCS